MAYHGALVTRAFAIGRAGALALGLLTCFGTSIVEAQWAYGDHVDAPASDLVATDGAWATSLNPSALAFLESWEIAILHQEALDPDRRSRGDAVYGATKLPFRLALGGGVEWRHGDGPRGGRASLALAWAKSSKLAFGGALRWVANDSGLGAPGRPDLSQRVGLDLAATWRPSSILGAALILEDLLGPAGLVRSDQEVPFRAVLAGQLRPFTDDQLILELAAAVDTTGALGIRGNVSLRVNRLGRLSAVAEVSDLQDGGVDYRVLGALSFDFGHGARLDVGGGIEPDFAMAGLRVRGAERAEGVHVAEHVDDLEIRGSLSPRRVLALVHRLEQDRVDPRVVGVLLRLRETDMSMAYAQEVREAIAALQAADKPVVCHLDAGGGSELYACGPARETLVDPAGGVRLLGPNIHVMLYGEALANLGVQTDFVRIGRFKSAVEAYTRGTMSEPARRQRDAFLDDVNARFVQDLARDREVSIERVQQWIDDGPYAAGEATEAELLHGTADERAMTPRLTEIFGTATLRKPRARVERSMGVPPRVGVVVIDGSIVDGDNVDLPIVNIHRTGSRTLVRTVEAMSADPSIRAIVVRIDSPGGSALASDQIWRALRRAAAQKPVIASMGAVAASGGYYVASACDEIFAVPTTVTGSIGIFFGKGDFSPLADRLGVHVEPLGRGRRAGAESLWRPFTADERAVLADKIRLWYRLFLRRIAEGREMPMERIHQLGQGRIWSGDAAQQLGLVDELGGFAAAIARARRLGRLPADSDVVMAPGRPSTLLEYLLGSMTPEASAPADAEAAASVAPALVQGAEMAVSMGGDGTVPMALMPAVIDVR